MREIDRRDGSPWWTKGLAEWEEMRVLELGMEKGWAVGEVGGLWGGGPRARWAFDVFFLVFVIFFFVFRLCNC